MYIILRVHIYIISMFSIKYILRHTQTDTHTHTDRGEQRVIEHEPLGAEGPARVGVQHRDTHRHVSAADGRGDVVAECAR